MVDVLRGVEGISFVQFDDRDVVRHSLVQKIVKAYERYNEAIGANRQLSLKLTGSAAASEAGRTSRPANRRPPERRSMSPDDIPLLFRHPSRRVRRDASCAILRRISSRRVARGRADHVPDHRPIANCARLNRKFRGKNYATDVLSFPSGRRRRNRDFPRSRRGAGRRATATALEDEVRILMLHGVLHLAGMDHETDSGEMARAETRWRKRLGLPSGPDREGARMTLLLDIAGRCWSALIVTLVTCVQVLYLESLRIRARELPSLAILQGNAGSRSSGLETERGSLTFSLVKHVGLAVIGCLTLAIDRCKSAPDCGRRSPVACLLAGVATRWSEPTSFRRSSIARAAGAGCCRWFRCFARWRSRCGRWSGRWNSCNRCSSWASAAAGRGAARPEEHIEALICAGEEEGIIEKGDRELIQSVVAFGDKTVREVMTPRPRIVAIRQDATLEELRQLVIHEQFSRIPVYRGNHRSDRRIRACARHVRAGRRRARRAQSARHHAARSARCPKPSR